VLKKNPATVKLVFKNYPIQRHKFAVNAAIAALAARRQGKFWEFHDELFENYKKLNEEKIREIAANLGLDEARFKEDRSSPDLLARVREDVREVKRLGLTGVPTVFVNGKKLKERSLSGFQAMIDRELEKQGAVKRPTGKEEP